MAQQLDLVSNLISSLFPRPTTVRYFSSFQEFHSWEKSQGKNSHSLGRGIETESSMRRSSFVIP